MRSSKRIIAVFALLALFFGASLASADRELVSVKVKQAPTLDGHDQDAAWQGVKPIAVKDRSSGATILLRSVYTDDEVFFFVQFPDPAENILHKPWMWDAATKSYVAGPHREDTFVFKWNMMETEVDLSNFADNSYRSDVWYWKANRSNPAGYADDKMQILADEPGKKSTELISVTGKKRYLTRKSDAGKPPYAEAKPTAYEGDLVDAFPPGTPDGSHADVHAKGLWKNGLWFIEEGRKLNTGHDDDVQFDPASGKTYLFGVSMFSLYGNPLDTSTPNLYGMGRISEPLRLKFQ